MPARLMPDSPIRPTRSTAAAGVPADGVPMPQRMWAILTIALGLTLAVLDGGIANVALPTIAREVNTSPANSIWVVNAYQLAVTIALLPLSSLGEIYGYRRIYQAGLTLFTLASLACSLSSSLPTLIVARMLQGLGAAGIMSVNSALIRFIYPRRWLGRGVGLNATVGSIASALGPSVASVILAVAPWPWLFAINVPLGLLGAVIALRTLPMTPLSGSRFDFPSAALQAVAFGLLLFGISEMGHGDSWVRVSVELTVAAVSGCVLVVRQLSRTAPLLPVDLLRIPLFALSVTTSVCAFIAQAAAQVSMPFLFEHHFGLDQVMTGLLMTPWPLVVAVIAPFAGRLADKYPAGLLGGAGLAVMGLGLLAMSLLPDHPSTLDIVWRMTLCGIGFGFFNTPNNRAIITSAPPIRTGGASGMQATARLLGQSTGAAMVALVFTAFPLTGTTVTLFIAAGVAGVAACVSFSRLTAA
ncbi:MFS transporter [Rhodopila sp.]|uniref:MFS transporter n=1 Tax=Rhodopila sp. TaxID=2480087 RepID=UPI003D1066DB